MGIIGQIINVVYTILLFISIAWIPLGLVLTVIFGIIYLFNKKPIFKKIAIIGLGGIPATILLLIIYFILSIVLNLLGIKLLNVALPYIK